MTGAHAASVVHPIAAAIDRILLFQLAPTVSPRQSPDLIEARKEGACKQAFDSVRLVVSALSGECDAFWANCPNYRGIKSPTGRPLATTRRVTRNHHSTVSNPVVVRENRRLTPDP